ncbi:hypothetical protein LCGC14_1342520 [marine sediment metagenome]|uniref:Uncharacterized protein n=1 Tax=marine sediment metagenome TaxID=412755 RepID=A0A0F9MU49_9ZZZZ
MDRNEQINKNVLAARAESEALLTSLVDKKIGKLRRRKQIQSYIISTILFLTFSALAFYLGAWFATSKGLCIG